MARIATCALAVGLAIAASGCLDFNDNNGPVMSVGLFWDERPDGAGFIGGTCESAGVSTMKWRLLDYKGKEVPANGSGEVQACTDEVDVIDPRPGEYALEITGYDPDDNPTWSAKCTGLNVLRFDVGYECDICDSAHPEACGNAGGN